MIKKAIFILAGLLFSFFLQAEQEVSPPTVKLDTAILSIGGQTHLRISLPAPQGKELVFPDFKDSIGHSLEILRKEIDTIIQKNGNRFVVHDYTITSFDTGHIYIPPFEIGVVENGFNSTVSTDTAHMYIAVPKIDMQKGIFDIKPPANLPFLFKEIVPYLKTTGFIVIILLLIVGILYYFLIYKKRKKQNTEIIEDTRPADIKAIEALYNLKEQELWQHGDTKKYYSELTDIIRKYLDERYQLQTMESTSNEIIGDLRKLDIEKEDRENLNTLFEHADFAKFAKGEPEAHENDKSWIDTRQFIENTKEDIIDDKLNSTIETEND